MRIKKKAGEHLSVGGMLKEKEQSRCSPGIQCLWNKILNSEIQFFIRDYLGRSFCAHRVRRALEGCYLSHGQTGPNFQPLPGPESYLLVTAIGSPTVSLPKLCRYCHLPLQWRIQDEAFLGLGRGQSLRSVCFRWKRRSATHRQVTLQRDLITEF